MESVRTLMKIANAAGVPGTLGCIAWTRDSRCVLLTTWHALFGRGASWSDPIWFVAGTATERRYSRIGRTLDGKIGTVRFHGDEYFVDCAIGTWAGVASGLPSFAGDAVAAGGATVAKTGAITGKTTGVVVDASYCGSVLVHGRTQPAPRQLLVRSTDERPFAAPGDSGALIVNEKNEAIGMLWGTTPRGDGVACPIGPVLRTLDITLAMRVA
jgi:hypothetical protein